MNMGMVGMKVRWQAGRHNPEEEENDTQRNVGSLSHAIFRVARENVDWTGCRFDVGISVDRNGEFGTVWARENSTFSVPFSDSARDFSSLVGVFCSYRRPIFLDRLGIFPARRRILHSSYSMRICEVRRLVRISWTAASLLLRFPRDFNFVTA